MGDIDVVELRREPRQGGPGLEKPFLLGGIETVEVIGDPDRVEVGKHGRKDVLGLIDRYRREITPCMRGSRREPAELQVVHDPNRNSSMPWW